MDANLIYLVDDEANIIDFVRVYLKKAFVCDRMSRWTL